MLTTANLPGIPHLNLNAQSALRAIGWPLKSLLRLIEEWRLADRQRRELSLLSDIELREMGLPQRPL
jgi:uncharacterized protein YjiS (DUF1127 family)